MTRIALWQADAGPQLQPMRADVRGQPHVHGPHGHVGHAAARLQPVIDSRQGDLQVDTLCWRHRIHQHCSSSAHVSKVNLS